MLSMCMFSLPLLVVLGILILYFIYKLKNNSIKEPNISQTEKENRKRQSNILQNILYIYGLIIPIIYNILTELPNSCFKHLSPIFISITIILIVFSLIFRAIKNKKVSNILCVIILVPYTFLLGVLGPQIITSIYEGPCLYYEVNSVNSRYEPYIGENISGSQVKKLVQQINKYNENEYNEIKVEIESDIIEIKKESYNINKIKNNHKYNATISEYYNKNSGYNGCIKKINIYEEVHNGQ